VHKLFEASLGRHTCTPSAWVGIAFNIFANKYSLLSGGSRNLE